MITDLPLDQLRTYRPPLQEPVDFDQFWATTLAETRAVPLAAQFTPIETPLRLVEIYDVTYHGYGGQPVKGWLLLPRTRAGTLPCVVEYGGYGGGRGLPHENLFWSVAGYAHFIMDTRGQGSVARQGDTPDSEPQGGNPQVPGFMTRGILDPTTYYYRRVYMDAVRAVETVRTHPAIQGNRVIVSGASQGGGITLAVAALQPDILAAMPDVPFLCHFPVALTLTDAHPYAEITRYCSIHRRHADQVMGTLAYFDGVHFATRAPAPALFSVALRDEICPPRTVFAAYNHYQGSKEIRVWPYNGHEGGESDQLTEKSAFVQSVLQDAEGGG